MYNTETLYNYAKQIDYSLNSDTSNNIDDRVLKVCQQAEKNFLENKKSIKEIESMKKSTEIKKTKASNTCNNFNFPKNEYSDLRLIDNFVKSDYVINNKSSSQGDKIFEDKFNRKNENIEQYYAVPNTIKSIEIEKMDKYQNTNLTSKEFPDNKMEFKNQNYTDKDKYKLPFKHKHLKSGRKCVKCEITKKYIIFLNIHRMDNHFDDKSNIKNKFNINYDINKLLLESKTLMKKLNFKKAYENLKLPISQGLSHADVYYLFGEICRILKKLEESEVYLLQCLKFEHHSPFVFYSLGLLYQEIEQYKYSVSFFKHFICLIQTSDAFYQLAKSYFGLNKSLKSAIYITKAINLNKNVYEYYKFRSELYDSMGFKELARDDKKIANKLNNII